MPDPLSFPIPTAIDTPRLHLRPFREDDAPQLHEALAESIDDLREHLWFLPWVAVTPSRAAAEQRCRQAAANFLLRTDLPYLAFARQTGRLVGSIGLHRTDWQLPRTEVGYWVRSSETGQGYAREGVTALTTWALRTLGACRVDLVTDERNHGSRAVAERCGFRQEGLLRHVMRRPDGRLTNSVLYARLAEEG